MLAALVATPIPSFFSKREKADADSAAVQVYPLAEAHPRKSACGLYRSRADAK